MAQDIALAVGQMLLQSLMNAVTNTISQFLTNAITTGLHSIADALGDLGTGLSWVEDAVHTFADNLSAELTSAVSSLTNNVNMYAQSTLGVINAQQRLHEQLVNVQEATLDYLFQKQRQEEEHRREVGAAVTALLLEYTSRRAGTLQQFVQDYREKVLHLPAEELGTLEGYTDEVMDILTDYVMNDLEFVESLAPEQLAAAESTVRAIVERNDRWFREWFLEVVVKPITTSNAMFQAMKNVFEIDPDTFKEQLKLFESVTTEYYEEKAHELARKVGEEGG
ncbi:MAG: hypothetical protein J7J28_05295 [Thaumarchaeota archaeon]|nr:hypothetical protein [Nitrososphaerota archaeon]